jgi:hypothetical protein
LFISQRVSSKNLENIVRAIQGISSDGSSSSVEVILVVMRASNYFMLSNQILFGTIK